MSAGIFIAGIVCGCVVSEVASALGKWSAKRWMAKAKKPDEPKTEGEASSPACKWQWHPMLCGTRLELGDTGFWIELVGKKGRQAYYGYDPEGDAVISGPDLQGMKSALEKQAKYRTEFAPAQWEKPWQ